MNGIKKTHLIAIVILILLIFFFVLSGSDDDEVDFNSAVISPQVLEAIRAQNVDDMLAYNESKPIIEDMKKSLYRYEAFLPTDQKTALGYLYIVKRRLLYLENKGLDVSNAEKIINDYLSEHTPQKEE